VATYASEYDDLMPESSRWNNVDNARISGPGASQLEWDRDAYDYQWPKWWGLGMLVGGRYVDALGTFDCPGYYSDYYASIYRGSDFVFDEKYYACLAAGEKNQRYSLFGAYRYNTYPYTHSWPWNESFTELRGRFGQAADISPTDTWEGSLADYGPVGEISSLAQCPYFGGHNEKGLNCMYVTGSVLWLNTPAEVREMWIPDGTVSNYGNRLNYSRKGLWRWASYMFSQAAP
jgi:hypothetical protein